MRVESQASVAQYTFPSLRHDVSRKNKRRKFDSLTWRDQSNGRGYANSENLADETANAFGG